MKKIISLVLVLALVSLFTVTSADTASAKGKKHAPIDVQATLYVVGIEGLETNEKTGWSTIERETLQGAAPIQVNAGPAELGNFVLSAVQSSKEKFDNPVLPLAHVTKGKSEGTFYMSDFGGGVQVVGEYKLNLSNSDECQILGKGHWKAVDGIIDGQGKISVCTNWVLDINVPVTFGYFQTDVEVTGKAALLD